MVWKELEGNQTLAHGHISRLGSCCQRLEHIPVTSPNTLHRPIVQTLQSVFERIFSEVMKIAPPICRSFKPFILKKRNLCAMCKCITYTSLSLGVEQIKSEISCIYEHTITYRVMLLMLCSQPLSCRLLCVRSYITAEVQNYFLSGWVSVSWP